MSRDVEITILNRKYVLRSEADERSLREVAAYVDEKLREVTATTTASQATVAVLGALNIALEFEEFRRKVGVALDVMDTQAEAVTLALAKELAS